ncbi:uncharacterized protein LOC125499972 [Athalia rosae]|uniref:uncharacterized protein LOC125499972 n=1 Tax=Athalia rosae TaxID=37344 RepID=UPI002033B8D1|nr:uncharacterized protein LOC125499972 [Athalia rosae]
MKSIKICIASFAALACLACEGSAQQNWWERGPDGSPMIATSRSTIGASTVVSTTPTIPAKCPCATTPEYNPVCGGLGGDNRLTYTNLGMLTCAKNCGQNVQLLFYGRCERV